MKILRRMRARVRVVQMSDSIPTRRRVAPGETADVRVMANQMVASRWTVSGYRNT